MAGHAAPTVGSQVLKKRVGQVDLSARTLGGKFSGKVSKRPILQLGQFDMDVATRLRIATESHCDRGYAEKTVNVHGYRP
jgi:hypothetical protein